MGGLSVAAAFDAGAEAWDAYTRSPLGRLRQELTLHYLLPHLQPLGPALSVLDAGGGTGSYALALARLGHAVSLVDSAAEMLAVAHRAVECASEPMPGQLEIHQACAEDIATLFAEGCFDVVLCHTLLEYVQDRGKVVRGLAGVLRPGGVMAVLFASQPAECLRWALAKGDLETARRVVGAGQGERACTDSLFGLPRRTLSPEEARYMLAEAGLTPQAAYGVRVLADYLQAARLAQPSYYMQILELEKSIGSRSPYREVARYGYLIAMKPAPDSTPGSES